MKYPFTFIDNDDATIDFKYPYDSDTNRLPINTFSTWNCQMQVCGGIEDFIFVANTKSDPKDFVLSFFKFMLQKLGKPLLLFDISQSKVESLLSYLNRGSLVMKSNFVSTNGSNRTILIINIMKL